MTTPATVAFDALAKRCEETLKRADCERATAFLEKALGRISGRSKKPEYYQREELKRQTTVVIIALLAFSLVLWVADLIFTAGILRLYKTK